MNFNANTKQKRTEEKITWKFDWQSKRANNLKRLWLVVTMTSLLAHYFRKIMILIWCFVIRFLGYLIFTWIRFRWIVNFGFENKSNIQFIIKNSLRKKENENVTLNTNLFCFIDTQLTHNKYHNCDFVMKQM